MVTPSENLSVDLSKGHKIKQWSREDPTWYIRHSTEGNFRWIDLELAKPDYTNMSEIYEDVEFVKTTDRDGRLSEWVPWRMVFNAPSEHTIAGKQMDLEL